MAKFSEELWQIAFQNVKELFKIENLHQEQVEGIKAFFETSSHVFINLPTGFGKSMIFQSLPLIADCLSTSYPGSFFGEGKTLVGAGHVTLTKLIA